jgi:hypothetical protein
LRTGPTGNSKTKDLYNQLDGMSAKDRDGFSKLNHMEYYGAMPVSQFNDLTDEDNEQ